MKERIKRLNRRPDNTDKLDPFDLFVQQLDDEAVNLRVDELDKLGSHKRDWILGNRLLRGLSAQRRLAAEEYMNRTERTSLEKEVHRGEQAQYQLILAYRHLCFSKAIGYYRKIAYSGGEIPDLLDLVQSGMEAMVRYAPGYDPLTGNTFGTYIGWYVWRAIQDCHHEVGAGQFGISSELIGNISDPDFTPVRGSDIKRPGQVAVASGLIEAGSLYQPINEGAEEGDTELVEVTSGLSLGDPEVGLLNIALRGQLEMLLDQLSPNEALYLGLYAGLVVAQTILVDPDGKKRSGGRKRIKDQTYKDIGLVMGVSGERARQITEQALNRLRHPSRSRKLRDYLTE